MSPVNRILSCLLAGWLLTTTVGCATMNLSKIDFRSRKASTRNPVVNIVCLWEPAEGKDPKGVPCPGFAGRIMFMNRDSLSVSVDGDVRIYEFDNVGTVEEQCKPIHQFDFGSEPWAQHYTYGTVGPCYNVFIPYMRKGSPGSTCSLRLRFNPKDGSAPVFSELTPIEVVHSHASGSAKKPLLKSSTSDSRVEQTTPEDLTSVNKRRRTTTIALDSKGGAMSESTVSPEAPAAPVIQQASYEEPKPLTESDAKIAQLEKMVRELQAMQGTVTPAKATVVKPAAATKPAPAPATPPRLLEEEPATPAAANPGRIKMRAVETPSAEQPASRRAESVDDAHSARTDRTEVRHHPLEDDSSYSVVTRAKPVAKRPRREVALDETEPSKPARRHPLDDDETDAPVKPTARKAIRAVEVAPQSEAEPRRTDNSFDPIETSSADESPTVRVRLRAVNQ